MPKPPKALIFDLDGVLVNSEALHRRTWLDALADHGIQLRESDITHSHGKTGDQVIDWLQNRPEAAANPIDRERLLERKRELFRARMADELQAVPGIDEFLRKQKGVYPLGLVTSSALKTVGQIMLVFNWRNIFDALIGAEHVAQTKPHPEPFLHAASRFKLHPSECLVFEDSAVGIQSATAAGMAVCGVATTLSPKELKSHGAKWTIEDFQDQPTLEMALQGHRPAGLLSWLTKR